jgi:hypothetical protein
MAQADRVHSTRASTRLSPLFTDPLVRSAFRRAEDEGHAFAIPSPSPDLLKGGAAENPRKSEERV